MIFTVFILIMFAAPICFVMFIEITNTVPDTEHTRENDYNEGSSMVFIGEVVEPLTHTHCISCGAPLHTTKCEFCGTMNTKENRKNDIDRLRQQLHAAK